MKGVEGAGGGVAGSAPLPFVCSLAPQRQELEEGTAERAEDRGRRRATPAGCGGHASPGIRGLLPGPGGKGSRKGGAVWAGGHFRWRDQSLGSEACEGPVAGQGAQGVRGGTASAPGGVPGRWVPGSCDPGLGPSSDPQRVSDPSGLAPSFYPLPLKICLARVLRCLVWGSFTETKQFSQGEKHHVKQFTDRPWWL